MKQWHLFGGRHYYPDGGMSDYVGAFDTLEEAVKAARPEGESGGIKYDWAHIATFNTEGRLVKVLEGWNGGWRKARVG